jgi:hypothetical protein
VQKLNFMVAKLETKAKSIGVKKIRYGLGAALIITLLLTVLLFIFYNTDESKENTTEEVLQEENPVSNPVNSIENTVASYPQEIEATTTTQENADIPSEQIDLTQWQIYKSTPYGIEFKYPNDWELVPNKDNEQYDNGADGTVETIRIRKIDSSLPSVNYGGNVYEASFLIDIAVIRNDERLNTREYLNKIDSNAVYRNVKIGNDIKAITFDQMIVGGPGPNPNKNTLFEHNGLLFQVHYYASVKPENKNELEYYQKNIYPKVLDSIKAL